MYYEEVFRSLNEREVKYLVVGGIAVNLYGVPRMTADLDMMLEIEPENLSGFITAISELGYKPRAPVDPADLIDPQKRKEWQRNKKAVVFSFFHAGKPYQEIDIFLENPIDFRAAYAEKNVVSVGRINIPLASIHHLELIKEKSGRAQDLSDIESLKKIEELRRQEERGSKDE